MSNRAEDVYIVMVDLKRMNQFKKVCVNFTSCYCQFCMHTFALIHISLLVCAYILNIRIGSTLHGGFDLPTGIWVGRYTIKSIQLAMYAKSQSGKKLFAGIYMYQGHNIIRPMFLWSYKNISLRTVLTETRPFWLKWCRFD